MGTLGKTNRTEDRRQRTEDKETKTEKGKTRGRKRLRDYVCLPHLPLNEKLELESEKLTKLKI